MGFSKKPESDAKKWAVIAGIGIRTPLKPILTENRNPDGAEDENSTTPTAREARIPEVMTCPAAPRKRRPVSTCQGVRNFFVVPDLESVFIRIGERAK